MICEILDLKLDWASYESSLYACKNWHYSKKIPVGKLVRIGVWENGKFIGVVIFSRGACDSLVDRYGLTIEEGCELTRIALSNHKSTVSKILSISIKFLKKKCPGIKLIVSYADPAEGHNGAIYQASNWIYDGNTKKGKEYFLNGKKYHSRNISSTGYKNIFGKKIKVPKPSDCIEIETPEKYRYLFPVDDSIKKTICKLAKPYPKRLKNQAIGDHPILAGEIPS